MESSADFSVDEVEITRRIHQVLERVEKACQRAGRTPKSVTLIAVTKTFPAEYVEIAQKAGLSDFGENKVQELVRKAMTYPGAVENGVVRWHMIGHLQRNKSKDIVRHADLFQTLDSVRLAAELDRKAREYGRILPCLVQVNTSGETTKSGIRPEDLPSLLDEMQRFSNLIVSGLMTIASPVEQAETVRVEFQLLRRMAERHRETAGHHNLEYLSMGMSSDFEVAIEEGATHIRLGTILFGSRN